MNLRWLQIDVGEGALTRRSRCRTIGVTLYHHGEKDMSDTTPPRNIIYFSSDANQIALAGIGTLPYTDIIVGFLVPDASLNLHGAGGAFNSDLQSNIQTLRIETKTKSARTQKRGHYRGVSYRVLAPGGLARSWRNP